MGRCLKKEGRKERRKEEERSKGDFFDFNFTA